MTYGDAIKRAWTEGNSLMIGRICDRLRFGHGINHGQFEEIVAAALNRPVDEIRARLDNLLYYADVEG